MHVLFVERHDLEETEIPTDLDQSAADLVVAAVGIGLEFIVSPPPVSVTKVIRPVIESNGFAFEFVCPHQRHLQHQ